MVHAVDVPVTADTKGGAKKGFFDDF